MAKGGQKGGNNSRVVFLVVWKAGRGRYREALAEALMCAQLAPRRETVPQDRTFETMDQQGTTITQN